MVLNFFSIRYRAELEPHPRMDRCYISKLRVDNVKMGDSRQYVVRAENDRGMDMVTIQLVVQGTIFSGRKGSQQLKDIADIFVIG